MVLMIIAKLILLTLEGWSLLLLLYNGGSPHTHGSFSRAVIVIFIVSILFHYAGIFNLTGE